MRAVVTAIRLTSEIERSGDLMVNVAKATRRLYGSPCRRRSRVSCRRWPTRASASSSLAMDAYADGDANLAGAIDDLDDRLDQLHQDYIQAILEHYADVRDVQAAVQLALVGRYYERIGDHAVNIGERVQYMVTGWLPEHTGARRRARLMLTAPARAPSALVLGAPRSPWCSSGSSASRAGSSTPAAGCPTTSSPAAPASPRPPRWSSGRSIGPCSGVARARSPKPGWRARWR